MQVGDLRVFKRDLKGTDRDLCDKVFVVTHVDTSRDAVRIVIIYSGQQDYWDKIHLAYCSKAVKDKKCP